MSPTSSSDAAATGRRGRSPAELAATSPPSGPGRGRLRGGGPGRQRDHAHRRHQDQARRGRGGAGRASAWPTSARTGTRRRRPRRLRSPRRRRPRSAGTSSASCRPTRRTAWSGTPASCTRSTGSASSAPSATRPAAATRPPRPTPADLPGPGQPGRRPVQGRRRRSARLPEVAAAIEAEPGLALGGVMAVAPLGVAAGDGVRLAARHLGYGARDQPGRDDHLGRDERRPRGRRSKRRDTPENWYGVARQQIAPGPVMSVA